MSRPDKPFFLPAGGYRVNNTPNELEETEARLRIENLVSRINITISPFTGGFIREAQVLEELQKHSEIELDVSINRAESYSSYNHVIGGKPSLADRILRREPKGKTVEVEPENVDVKWSRTGNHRELSVELGYSVDPYKTEIRYLKTKEKELEPNTGYCNFQYEDYKEYITILLQSTYGMISSLSRRGVESGRIDQPDLTLAGLAAKISLLGQEWRTLMIRFSWPTQYTDNIDRDIDVCLRPTRFEESNPRVYKYHPEVQKNSFVVAGYGDPDLPTFKGILDTFSEDFYLNLLKATFAVIPEDLKFK